MKNVSLRKGGYSVGITAVVLVIIVVFNLLVDRLPVSLTQYDISSTNIYDISETTEELLNGLEEDVTITVLKDRDSVDTMVSTFLEKYAEKSGHLKLEYVDTVLHPSAPENYGAEDGSVVVTNETSGKTTSFLLSDMYGYDEMSYYYYGTNQATTFDGEGKLTGAINQVVSGAEGKVYLAEGHGEATFSEAVTDLLSKSNITVESLNTLTATEIPEDCDVLVLNGPGSDLTGDEVEMLDGYLAGGGHVTVLLSNNTGGLTNLYGLLGEYGMNVEEGYVSDPSRGYQGNGYAIVPVLSLEDSLAENMDSDSVLVYGVYGLTERDMTGGDGTEAAADADLSEYEEATPMVTGFMHTSENASLIIYDQAEDANGAAGAGYSETEAGSGQYMLGAYSVKGDGRLTVYSGASIIDSGITDSFPSLQNLTLFMNTLTVDMDDIEPITIEAKSLQTETNSVSKPGFFSFVFIILVPLAILFWGFMTWRKRRKA